MTEVDSWLVSRVPAFSLHLKSTKSSLSKIRIWPWQSPSLKLLARDGCSGVHLQSQRLTQRWEDNFSTGTLRLAWETSWRWYSPQDERLLGPHGLIAVDHSRPVSIGALSFPSLVSAFHSHDTDSRNYFTGRKGLLTMFTHSSVDFGPWLSSLSLGLGPLLWSVKWSVRYLMTWRSPNTTYLLKVLPLSCITKLSAHTLMRGHLEYCNPLFWLQSLFLLDFSCCRKHYNQKQLKEERVYRTLPSRQQSITEGRQVGAWKQELNQGSPRNTAPWLSPKLTFNHLSNPGALA